VSELSTISIDLVNCDIPSKPILIKLTKGGCYAKTQSTELAPDGGREVAYLIQGRKTFIKGRHIDRICHKSTFINTKVCPGNVAERKYSFTAASANSPCCGGC
jgi:hypothetical protein